MVRSFAAISCTKFNCLALGGASTLRFLQKWFDPSISFRMEWAVCQLDYSVDRFLLCVYFSHDGSFTPTTHSFIHTFIHSFAYLFIYLFYFLFFSATALDIRGMDNVNHNHTYALGSEASGTSQRPVSRDKHRGAMMIIYCLQFELTLHAIYFVSFIQVIIRVYVAV